MPSFLPYSITIINNKRKILIFNLLNHSYTKNNVRHKVFISFSRLKNQNNNLKHANIPLYPSLYNHVAISIFR